MAMVHRAGRNCSLTSAPRLVLHICTPEEQMLLLLDCPFLRKGDKGHEIPVFLPYYNCLYRHSHKVLDAADDLRNGGRGKLHCLWDEQQQAQYL